MGYGQIVIAVTGLELDAGNRPSDQISILVFQAYTLNIDIVQVIVLEIMKLETCCPLLCGEHFQGIFQAENGVIGQERGVTNLRHGASPWL
jgi:hypothetical protein